MRWLVVPVHIGSLSCIGGNRFSIQELPPRKSSNFLEPSLSLSLKLSFLSPPVYVFYIQGIPICHICLNFYPNDPGPFCLQGSFFYFLCRKWALPFSVFLFSVLYANLSTLLQSLNKQKIIQDQNLAWQTGTQLSTLFNTNILPDFCHVIFCLTLKTF